MRDQTIDPAVLARLLAALANHQGPSLPPTQPTSPPASGGVGLFGGIPAGDPAAAAYQPDPYPPLGRPRRQGDPGWPWMP